MFRLFTFNSDWKRIGREVLRVVLVLLALELVVRIGPIHALLAARLDPYENLLWYDDLPTRYQNQLRADPNYTIWLLGSSPMMTAWKPAQIQDVLRQTGHDGFTVQNYGFTSMISLRVMAQLIDRWLLQLDQPQYAVLGISQINFSRSTANRMRIEDSPYESTFIYPDSLDDYANQFLYSHSILYRYMILARNAFITPIDATSREPYLEGGYTEREDTTSCDNPDTIVVRERERGPQYEYFQNNLDRLDEMINTIEARHIPVLVVSLPISRCQLEQNYGGTAEYRQLYLDPVGDHLRQRGTAFVELDTLFYDRISPDEQNSYFFDGTHTNATGAALLSRWLSDAIDEWLKTDPSPPSM
jgi:hypothetical protein